MRSSRMLRSLFVIVAYALPIAALAQSLPTLTDIVQIATVEASTSPSGTTTYTTVDLRAATLEELTHAAFEDIDGDEVISLYDACPVNPYCTTAEDLADADGDGRPAWGDGDDTNPAIRTKGDPAIDALPDTDRVTALVSLFESPEAMLTEFFRQNQEQDLYPVGPLLEAAAAAGVDPALLEVIRRRYPDCELCTKDCEAPCGARCERIAAKRLAQLEKRREKREHQDGKHLGSRHEEEQAERIQTWLAECQEKCSRRCAHRCHKLCRTDCPGDDDPPEGEENEADESHGKSGKGKDSRPWLGDGKNSREEPPGKPPSGVFSPDVGPGKPDGPERPDRPEKKPGETGETERPGKRGRR